MSRIRPMKFVHVVYRTRRFEPMVRWYQTVFGAKVQYQNPALAFLTYDDEHHRIPTTGWRGCGPVVLPRSFSCVALMNRCRRSVARSQANRAGEQEPRT